MPKAPGQLIWARPIPRHSRAMKTGESASSSSSAGTPPSATPSDTAGRRDSTRPTPGSSTSTQAPGRHVHRWRRIGIGRIRVSVGWPPEGRPHPDPHERPGADKAMMGGHHDGVMVGCHDDRVRPLGSHHNGVRRHRARTLNPLSVPCMGRQGDNEEEGDRHCGTD